MDKRYALSLQWCFMDTLKGEGENLRKHLGLSKKEMSVVLSTPPPDEMPPASTRMDSAVRLAQGYQHLAPSDRARIQGYTPTRVVMEKLTGCKHPKGYTHAN